MDIRRYISSDCKETAELFYNTVHAVNAKDYTKEQLDAWADGKTDLEAWNQSLLGHFVLVCVKNNIIVGFGDIDNTGYLDRLYVHKDFQRQGIATAICNSLEQAAGTLRIVTHASVTAKPFFEHRGYKVIKKQQVIRKGIYLTNYIMEK